MKTTQLCLLLTLGLCLAQEKLKAQMHEGTAYGKEDALPYDAPLKFRNVGPSRGGRVTAVRGLVQDPSTFYMGSTGGGLWKTSNYGTSWNNLSDGYFGSPSIGAIGISQSNPRILYVGTGSDAIRSNVIVGKGIYKSENGGKSWSFCGLQNAGQIGALEVHPGNPDVAFAAVMGQAFRKSKERGVYRTRDGGQTWEQVLFSSDSVGAVDLELAPGNPDLIYAALWRAERKPWTIISGGAEDGIYRSEDGGSTWMQLSNGLPNSLVGKIDLAVSPAMPSRVWAQVQASEGQGGIYRSDDYGVSWEKVPLPEKMLRAIMHRPFYFTNLSVNPRQPDHLYAGAVRLYQSRDGGLHWEAMNTSHGDHHDLWIHPLDTLLMVEGNDGGASVSRDGGLSWSTLHNQATAELYTCDVDDRHPFRLYSGQQDNSTIAVPSRPPGQGVFNAATSKAGDDIRNWEMVGGCETGPVVPKPGDPSIVYANCKGRFSVYHRPSQIEQEYYVGAENLYGAHPEDLQYRFQRVAPIEVSPFDPEVVYYGSQYLHRTRDGGVHWEQVSPDLSANEPAYRMRSGGPIDEDITGEEHYAVLYAIRESPLQKGLIWTGSNDGLVHVTRDGGKTWTNVTPSMPGGGRVSKVDASTHRAGKALVAINRDYLGDDRPYFFLTEDYGTTWIQLSEGGAGIPQDHPARVIREDPVKEGLLYAGTEFGLFFSTNNGAQWTPLQRNLPVTPVSDLQVFRNDLVLSTMGRSFWVMDDITPLRYLQQEHTEEPRLFPPRPVYNQAHTTAFYLPEDWEGRQFKLSWYRGEELLFELEDKLELLHRDALGFYRVAWDQHHYVSVDEGFIRGPRVAPGSFRVVLSLDGFHQEQAFRIDMHPDLEALGTTKEHLQEQEALAMKALFLRVDMEGKVEDLERALKDTRRTRKREALEQQLMALKKGANPYDKPGMLDQLQYLYRMITSTPQQLGTDAGKRLQELEKQWEAYLTD